MAKLLGTRSLHYLTKEEQALWVDGGKRVLYQEGPVSGMRHPDDLLARFEKDGRFADGSLMFCGTHAVHGGLRPAARFEFELEDPVRGRKIAHGYDVVSLPILG